MRTFTFLILALCFAGCDSSTKNADLHSVHEPHSEISDTQSVSTKPIRSIDFRNFSFPLVGRSTETNKEIALEEGVKDLPGLGSLALKQILYGDLVDDFEGDEAAIIISIEDGNATNHLLFVFAMIGSTPRLLQSFEYDSFDRLRTVFIAHGELGIETAASGSDAMCCPSTIEISYFAWQDGKFQIQGDSQKIQNGYVERLKKKRE